MNHAHKTTVTLGLIWIAAMGIVSTPEWVRAARDFISGSTGHVVNSGGYKGDTTGKTHGK